MVKDKDNKVAEKARDWNKDVLWRREGEIKPLVVGRWEWWHTPLILALRREVDQLEASLVCREILSQKLKKKLERWLSG